MLPALGVVHSNPMGVPGGTGGTMFSSVPVELVAHSAELVGINVAQKTKFSKTKTFEPLTDLSQFTSAVQNIEDMIDSLAGGYSHCHLAGNARSRSVCVACFAWCSESLADWGERFIISAILLRFWCPCS